MSMPSVGRLLAAEGPYSVLSWDADCEHKLRKNFPEEDKCEKKDGWSQRRRKSDHSWN